MMLRRWFYLGFLWSVCIACVGGGVPTAYYTLQSVSETPPATERPRNGSLVIGLGPVELPDYLDRSAIVTRLTANRLEVNGGHRWAGSLTSEITRALAADLGSRLPAKGVLQFPWAAKVTPDWRFRVEIQNFEGGPGKTVTLKAAWSLTPSQSEQPTLRKVSLFHEKIKGNGFDALAAAMGRALAALSAEMAGSVPKKDQ